MTVHPLPAQANANLTSLTFEELEIGQTVKSLRSLTLSDVNLFAAMSGNVDPLHFPASDQDAFQSEPIGHGMWAGSIFSGILGTELPGPGTILEKHSFELLEQIPLGTTFNVIVSVAKKLPGEDGKRNRVIMDCRCESLEGRILVKGDATVIPPKEHRSQKAQSLPQMQFIAHDQLESLTAKCVDLPPLPTSVVYPCDRTSLQGAYEGARLGLIDPVLVGPEILIRQLAYENDIDISMFRLVDAEHEGDAAIKGVALARNSETRAVMKGSLHTDELMAAVVRRDIGLRTNRRISHVFVMNVPSYPKPLLITDAVVNISPNADDKSHIIQNAVELANILGVETPKVAILSAVETVNPKIISTVDAAVLCKMADRGQIRGAILDGPLALDNAISKEAALTKGIKSEVAGDADILLAPDLASSNMLVKQLSFLAHADAAGIVLGASVPVILTSRADSLPARLASCALAVLLAKDHSNKYV